jgi:hypothetical protein
MKKFIRWIWFKILFSNYSWYRKLYGGHWELWHIDYPVCSIIWCDVKECSKSTGYREPLWRGTPICEHYPQTPTPRPN